MAGVITINFKVMKNGIADLGIKSPLYLPGPVEPHYGPGRYLTFEGFSVDQHGKQHYMDVTVAYRQTILRKSSFLHFLYTEPINLLHKQVALNISPVLDTNRIKYTFS
jgi:acetamidase/formamidase